MCWEEIRCQVDDVALSFDTTRPDADVAALKQLDDIFEGKVLVGLGESTHGTREFFQMKHRIIKFLVQNRGFSLFCLEANFAETIAINDYVVHGIGDAETALAQVYYWTWNTEELLELIEWIRLYNKGRPMDARVRFHGVDMRHSKGPIVAIDTFLRDTQTDVRDRLVDDLRVVARGFWEGDHWSDVSAARIERARNLISFLRSKLDEYEAKTVSTMSNRDLQHVRQCVRVLEQATEYATVMNCDGLEHASETRDEFMAENLFWNMEHESCKKAIIWAHNGHIRKGSVTDASSGTLGSHLSDTFGDRYYALALEFGRGSFTALSAAHETGERELQEFTVETPPNKRSVEDNPAFFSEDLFGPPFHAVVDRISHEILILDFTQLMTKDSVKEWLEQPHSIHEIGVKYCPDRSEEYVYRSILPREFDGLLYVREATPTAILDSR